MRDILLVTALAALIALLWGVAFSDAVEGLAAKTLIGAMAGAGLGWLLISVQKMARGRGRSASTTAIVLVTLIVFLLMVFTGILYHAMDSLVGKLLIVAVAGALLGWLLITVQRIVGLTRSG